ncbi:DNA (cytosine-5-)-methyltransferase [Cysteiniphilum sp. 6C5]|uniref:DNA (cytosine-5-)-methyltransferase n=1 Tax=unclassified Cysteiniphilum TaxID=2610889 RepID=UPI003F83E9CD
MKEYYSLSEISDILSVSKETLRRWDKSGKLTSIRHPINNYRVYHQSQILQFEQAKLMLTSNWDAEMSIKPLNEYSSIEIFAGAGGLALGLEKAGFKHVFLNEIDKDACATLKHNRPHWNICHADISIVNFNEYKYKIDLLSGGFPCQAFSYAGKKLGFDDIRGTLFFEFARAAKEIQPKILLAENVRGLLSHDNGNTFRTIKEVFDEIGYVFLAEPKVLKAIFFQVPQKRERLFFVAVRKDLFFDELSFDWPSPYKKILTLKDALKKGDLYDCDVPESIGSVYPKRKREILDHVPQGGYWRHLPDDLQKEYMQKSYFLGGGKTGMARRLSWEEPSLTLTCAPAQKQTERCHPEETRPLTIREYARIQTFPDDWKFCGSMSSQYKQIGNAVPVNLSYAIGRSIVSLLNQLP